MMKMKANARSLIAMAMTITIIAMTPSNAFETSRVSSRASSPALHYKNGHENYDNMVDVDGDRTSLRSLLLPPVAPWVPPAEAASEVSTEELRVVAASSITSSSSRVVQPRNSHITQLHTIQDYQRQVLHEPDQLCIIRFSAPWCKVCRSTNVSWERMASKLHKMMTVLPTTSSRFISNNDKTSSERNKQVKFFSVNVDGRDEATAALKDMLGIDRVPQGIIHHPAQELIGLKVDLNRSGLSTLKKKLERYLGGEEDVGLQH